MKESKWEGSAQYHIMIPHAPVAKRHFAWLASCHVHSTIKPDSQKDAEELKVEQKG